MRGGPRKGFGGAQPGAGRKPNAVKTLPTKFMLTEVQQDEARHQGGSPWLQGVLNLIDREAKAGAETVTLAIVPRAPE